MKTIGKDAETIGLGVSDYGVRRCQERRTRPSVTAKPFGAAVSEVPRRPTRQWH